MNLYELAFEHEAHGGGWNYATFMCQYGNLDPVDPGFVDQLDAVMAWAKRMIAMHGKTRYHKVSLCKPVVINDDGKAITNPCSTVVAYTDSDDLWVGPWSFTNRPGE